jgi:DNA-directed RNA polymerase subunit RPC12/RpoP
LRDGRLLGDASSAENLIGMDNSDDKINFPCPNCFEQLSFLEEEDFYICPHCSQTIILDKERFQTNFKKAMRRVYGDKPEKPELN